MKVLISKGYGAGWSTWNCEEMATDPELIRLFEDGCTEEEMCDACVNKGYGSDHALGYTNSPYMGGFSGLEVYEVPKGRFFTIREYDGNEYVEILNLSEWILAE